ncbi:JmjC domain-containing protein 7, partial [Chytridiales sp. JEL 0842]
MRLVAENRPAVFEGAVDEHDEDWPAMRKWVQEGYLSQVMGDQLVTVAVTPNGLADGVVDGMFCLPHEAKMTMQEFISVSGKSGEPSRNWTPGAATSSPVYYLQSQNNNMHEELSRLLKDVPNSIAFADEALGDAPEAVNFWMGSRHAVTSAHKDHYENLYVVISGEKTFTLIPPSE